MEPALSASPKSQTPQRKTGKAPTDLEDLKDMMKSGLYSILMEPGTMQGLRDLLKCQDKQTRLKAWELALKHAVPVTKDMSEDGGGKIQVNFNIPRPQVDVTPVKTSEG